MRHAWVLVLLFAGCYPIEFTSGKFSCNRDSDCPGALVCRATGEGQRCVDAQTPILMPKDLASQAPDLLEPPDLAVPDLVEIDLMPIPDLAPASPCVGAGTLLATGVWACRGDFAVGAAETLCKDPGYHVCEAADPLAAWAGCATVPGFYASQVRIENVGTLGMTTYQIDCNIGQNVDRTWGLLGCGLQVGIRSAFVLSGPCPPLPHVMRCGNSGAWDCPSGAGAGTLAAMSHNGTDTLGGGVLCCRNR